MAGIFDRVIRTGSETDSPIGSLTLWACVYAVGRGIAELQALMLELQARLASMETWRTSVEAAWPNMEK